ncbi:MAG: hypothetical protein GC168_04025 [Candidatus Hydrogenedens sp.]|nr:hypothetical protein [Candidatus Hydrogenedens sp.]
MRIAVAGSGQLGATVLRPLLESRHEIVAVVQDGRQTRGWKRPFAFLAGALLGGPNNMLKLAARGRVPIFWIDRMDEAELAPLRARNIDVLLVSGFAIILKEPLLSLPAVGCVNMHSSLLPRHRGPNPFSAVITQGEKESGVTFHVMETGIDTGDILDQTAFPLGERDDMYTVYRQACRIAGERIVAVMDRIEQEGLSGTPQNPAEATYDPKPKPETAWIDWTRPAREIDQLVRGYAPSVLPRFRHEGREVYVARTQFDEESSTEPPGTIVRLSRSVKVATGEGTLHIRAAFTRSPIPWVWPAPWNKPFEGDRLE